MQDDLNQLGHDFPALKDVAFSRRANAANSTKYASFFANLSQQLKQQVCEVYKEDFELFGYECDFDNIL